MEEKLILSVSEVIHMTGLSRSYIYTVLRNGELPVVKIGKRTLVRRIDLDGFINKNLSVAGAA